MNAPPTNPSRALRAYAVAARGLLWLLAAFWLALVLAWGALHGFIVPRIGELRPELEKQAGRALGVPVRIGSVQARSEGLIPSFELQDVVLLDAQQRPALTLPRVLVALSPRSLLNLGFEQLYIDKPELDIRRATDGRLVVAGLDLSRTGDNDGRAADWFFEQSEFVIRGGTIRWTDEMRHAPPLALGDVDLVVRNKSRRHSIRLDATPPPEWGERFTLAAQFRQPLLVRHGGHWQHWAGQVYGDFARVDLSQLRRHADLGVQITQGRGALRAWVDVEKGQVVGGTADVVLADVDARLGPKLEPLALVSVAGRLGGKRFEEGFEFETQGLQFQTRDGHRWPGGNVKVSWSAAHGQLPAQGEFKGDKLDLAALTQVATRLPLGTPTHAALTAYSPQGLVDIQAKWQGPVDAPVSYEAKGRATALQVAARPDPRNQAAGTPGVRGANIDFDLTHKGGKARLAMENGALEFPGVFEEPAIPVATLAGDVLWQLDGAQASVTLNNMKFANADAQGEAKATWRTSDPAKSVSKSRFPGVLDLQATLSRADGTRVWRYLPLGVPKTARDYVHESVQHGTATNAKFRVRGDLAEFPFPENRNGEFLVTADVQGATYAYVPQSANKGPGQWPALTQLAGELVFQGNGMQVKNARGLFGAPSKLQVKAEAQIPDFRSTVVAVKGQVQGPLGEALGVVNTSPMSAMTNQALAKSKATGNADVQLQLNLPVAKIENSQVLGTITLANNDLQITPDSPMLARAKGTVTFSEKGFRIAGGQARALGGDARIEGGSRTLPPGSLDAPIVVRAQGVATADGLRQARELGFISRLAREMAGSANYSLTLGVRRGSPEILVTSNLQGMALNLPAPLAKTAEGVLPLRYETIATRDAMMAPEGSPVRMQDQLTLDIGRIANVHYVRDVSGADAKVLRGTIAVGLAPGESVSLPDAGVMANINLAGFNVDAWEDVLTRATTEEQAAAGAPVPTVAASPFRAAAGGPGYIPTLMAVRAKELSVEGRTLHNVVMGGSRDGLTWRANIDADELNGYLEYRQPSGQGAGRLHARLARLKLAAAAANEVESLLDDQVNSIPALDIVVDDFELKGKKLGKLEIDATNRGAGTVQREGGIREWRLNKLALTTPEAVFTATGNWAAIGATAVPPGGPRQAPRAEKKRTAMKFQLDIADAGGLLARFGMKEIVRRGRGKLEGQIAWVGSPLALDYPSLSGAFQVNVESGQFLKADPGLAKLLGVLSLQSLPRRLVLDFRDVFTEGFSFDFIRGDVAIEQGIASTNNLQMKGVNAAVLMEGKADIARETQDIKVVVVPEINAGTASLVATMINPAIGLGSFLAQMFLRQPLIRAATQEFHIDGTWSDPRVTKLSGRSPTSTSGNAADNTATR
ncbi:YhdP family protein [Ramlibacter albus]|uniref:TIGR02099 family protein n=1 Tax=Ramlibacter albus TaxID=2079448 RepID=A0A923S0U3_9BURK|nr:YhdP family protein [Ramlibacter albus]MBC5763610.1 TIGR02099 family protein [Ramlibacter albus]